MSISTSTIVYNIKVCNAILWVGTAWMSILLIWSFCLQRKVNVRYQGVTFDFDPKEAHYFSYTQHSSNDMKRNVSSNVETSWNLKISDCAMCTKGKLSAFPVGNKYCVMQTFKSKSFE